MERTETAIEAKKKKAPGMSIFRMRESRQWGEAPLAQLFCKCSHVVFMPYGVGLKDERPTSNVQRRTSNNDVATLRKLILLVLLFLFLFIPSAPLRAVSLSNGSFDTRNEKLN
jgi:hypothetical protein